MAVKRNVLKKNSKKKSSSPILHLEQVSLPHCSANEQVLFQKTNKTINQI